ncbi:isoprenoid synthase domain-containing protein [Fusarium oxysporum]|nr:isoprenoid synthase domain-containing protein [Fusarium oxysporum]
MKKRVEFCDFAVFISIAAPDAPFDKLKTMCDWGNWVFPFDDMFDEGSLKSDPKRSQVVIDSLMADMLDKTYTRTKSAVVQSHDDIFRRVSQEMLDTRRLSSGVTPLYHLIEYAHDIKLPDEVFENPIIQRLELLGADFVLLSNDILSYRKEENDDCPFSMVAACRMTGQSPQEAFDTVGNLLEERYQYWQKAIEQLPSWGPEIDANVARYIQGIQNVVQANITWSFRSGRYFGKQAPEIRRTRMIDVMVNPPYLQARQLRSGLRGVTDPTTWNSSFGVKPAVNIEFRLNKNIKAETNDQLRDQDLSVRPVCLGKKADSGKPRQALSGEKRRADRLITSQLSSSLRHGMHVSGSMPSIGPIHFLFPPATASLSATSQ